MDDLRGDRRRRRFAVCLGGRNPAVSHPHRGRHCLWYRELDGDPEEKLDYRFTGPSTVFDEVAASLLDPLDAVLHGSIKVRGDMRFLLRQAELVNVLLGAYTSGVATTWPSGRPPYQKVGATIDA